MPKRFCYNCGRGGHIYTNCLFPVMSYGGVLYQMRDSVPYYLMVQRTYTPDFKEIVRGKFDINDISYIRKLISRITVQEINMIYEYNHRTLYHNIQKFCKVKKNKQYHQKYKIAKENYHKLLNGTTNDHGVHLKFSHMVKADNQSYYLEPDWGFPKGRRNYKGNEDDLSCAIREINEETGISSDNYRIIPKYYVTEVYLGSNNIKYAHRYYVAECRNDINYFIDPFNKHQAGEIRKLAWFKLSDAISMIRPYHIEKKKVLLRVNRKITGQMIYIDLKNVADAPKNTIFQHSGNLIHVSSEVKEDDDESSSMVINDVISNNSIESDIEPEEKFDCVNPEIVANDDDDDFYESDEVDAKYEDYYDMELENRNYRTGLKKRQRK